MLQRNARKGMLLRLHRGLYAAPLTSDSEAEAGSIERQRNEWLQRLGGHLERAGSLSAISHRAAGELHRLEGVGGHHEDISVPRVSGWKTSPAIRSTLLGSEVTTVSGLRVTSVERTLADLGRFLSADQLEFAVEHALRGSDRRRPDRWNENLLARLGAIPASSRRPGLAVLRTVLVRRGTQRPTGSYAETELAQGLRTVGVVLVRQPTILVFGPDYRRQHRFFPDFADLVCGLLIEVNGRDGHTGDDNVDRDDRRLNELSRAFQILRYSARQVHRDSVGVARSIGEVQRGLTKRGERWDGPSVSAILTADGANMWHR